MIVDGSYEKGKEPKVAKSTDIIDKYCTRVSIQEDLLLTQWLFLIDMRTQLKIIFSALAKNNFGMTSRLEKI